MCSPGESGLTYRNSYWFPHQWADAVKAAIREGRQEGRKFHVFSAPLHIKLGRSWRIEPSPIRNGETDA